MDQQFDNSHDELLEKLLADPADDAPAYFSNLQRLVNDHPQSGILQALLAYTSGEKNLKQVSAYFNSGALFKLINDVSTLPDVADDRIIIAKSLRAKYPVQINGRQTETPEILTEAVDDGSDNSVGENYFSEPAGIIDNRDDAESNGDESKIFDHSEVSLKSVDECEERLSSAVDESLNGKSTVTPFQSEMGIDDHDEEDTIDQKLVSSEVAESVSPQTPIETTVNDTTVSVEQSEHDIEDTFTKNACFQPVAPVTAADPLPDSNDPDEKPEAVAAIAAGADNNSIENTPSEPGDIDDEVFDEILGIEYIDTSPEQVKQLVFTVPDQQPGTEEDIEQIEEGIVPGNFFTAESLFDKNHEAELPEQNLLPESEAVADVTDEDAAVSNGLQDVAKYNDDKMPYTFMWWLDKTRQQHSGIFQPYVKPDTEEVSAAPKNVADELQQQYYENIFHLTSIEEVEKNMPQPPLAAAPKRKEQVIIERFIKEEPQIRPQSGDKLDNENKAKKSAEDKDELVTETLAGIYSDQMLYHKAIASYKKLMLKSPEKNAYFANKIAQVEKKIN